MLSTDDIIEWAGLEGVVQGRAEIVAQWEIPADDRRVLTEVGIPRQVQPFFEAAFQPEAEPILRSAELGGLYKVGWDLGRDIGIATGARGVYAIDPDEPEDDAFVNSSAVRLAEFLHHAGRVRGEFPRMSDAEIDDAVARLKSNLEALDNAAFAEPGHWWALVFEQMEAGLL